MVSDVQSWLDDPGNNFGWLIQGNESLGQTVKRLNSRESTDPPQLTITYSFGSSLSPIPEPNSLVSMVLGSLWLFRWRRSKHKG